MNFYDAFGPSREEHPDEPEGRGQDEESPDAIISFEEMDADREAQGLDWDDDLEGQGQPPCGRCGSTPAAFEMTVEQGRQARDGAETVREIVETLPRYWCEACCDRLIEGNVTVEELIEEFKGLKRAEKMIKGERWEGEESQ